MIDEDTLNEMNVRVVKHDFITKDEETLKHDPIKLSLKIFEELIK